MAVRIYLERGRLLGVSTKALLSLSFFALFCVPGALASERPEFKLGLDATIQPTASTRHYSGGNDRFHVQVSANDSEFLGRGIRDAVDGYLADAMALTFEYGENRRE